MAAQYELTLSPETAEMAPPAVTSGREEEQAEYVSFWENVGETFPSLKGAVSTAYYFECERLLLEQYFPPLAGKTIYKTDLWDEAKNTEILRWAADQGARPYGADIAGEVVHEARQVLQGRQPGFAVGDVRAIPFQEGAFDLLYSMGTIEHFPDYQLAVEEIYRVLKPGGTAIIGVPNKTDPFLRPLMVHCMNQFKLYDYGMEKSFTHGELARLLEGVGFQVQAHSGVLFIPGWLRMADLLCHTKYPPLAKLTGALVKPFAWLYRHLPAVRRHGYLLACVVTKPVNAPDDRSAEQESAAAGLNGRTGGAH
jgi:SAM-dependent methyltransferase